MHWLAVPLPLPGPALARSTPHKRSKRRLPAALAFGGREDVRGPLPAERAHPTRDLVRETGFHRRREIDAAGKRKARRGSVATFAFGGGELDAKMMTTTSAAVLLFFMALGGVGLGYRGTTRPRLQAAGQCFSSGVLLSAGLVHLLGEASEGLAGAWGGFPVATMLCGAGFLITLVASETAILMTKDASDSAGQERESHGASLSGGGSMGTGNRKDCNFCSEAKVDLEEGMPLKSQMEDHDADADDKEKKASVAASKLLDGGVRATESGWLKVVLLTTALSFHSAIEGAALGSQSTAERTAGIAVAIAAHKGFGALALGSRLQAAKEPVRRFWLVALPFALATPMGAALGGPLGALGQYVPALLSATAAGTFVYVSVADLLPVELERARAEGQVPMALASVLTGFGAMSLLAKWV